MDPLLGPFGAIRVSYLKGGIACLNPYTYIIFSNQGIP